MSLFKTRDIWSASCDNDLFDLGCLKVANLGANKRYQFSIVTGSYNGFLRIYNPSTALDARSGGDIGGDSFKAHDLICETSFPSPIIQIETGRFVGASKKKHIAVLLPKKLAVYEVLAFSEGNVAHGNQYTLKFIYEHVLQRTAYNMCKGSFGGITSSSADSAHEYLCVQSIDGMLSIYEYESFSISCILPKVLIPGPFRYVPKTDSFVTVSSSWELESYKYQTLATSAKSFERNASETTGTKLKRLLPEHTYNIGEAALDLDIVTQSNGQCFIVVLGERSLYCFSETCALKYMKKFDYNPSAFCVYPIIGANAQPTSLSFIVATHSKVLFVHQDVKVRWAAQVDHVPVQIAVAKINDIKGIVVTLSEDGKLKCCYMGTEPAMLNPLIKDEMFNKSFNYKTAEEEYRVLQGQIKNAILNAGAVMTQASAKSGLQITVDVPQRLDSPGGFSSQRETELKDPIDAIPSITCKLTLRAGLEAVQNVKVTLNACAPLVAVPDVICFANIGSIPYEQEVVFYMKTKHIPSSLNVSACASYTSAVQGVSRVAEVAEVHFRLPIKLLMKSGMQTIKMNNDQPGEDPNASYSQSSSNSKNSYKKVTIETNKPCVNLIDLFPEFSSSYMPANGNILAAQFYGHAHINILVQGSKSGSSRYRIQSETFDSLYLITDEFVKRLNAHYTKQSQTIEIYHKESLPLYDFREIIDKHLQSRQHLDRYKEMLEQTCVQFRAIQKRLLTKFKDKSPTSLENMDALLEATYKQILSLSESYLNTQKELSLIANSLNCMSSLYVLLIGIAFRLDKDALQILENSLTTQVSDTPDLGWEEIINAAIANLLRNSLSRSSKDSTQQQPPLAQLKIPIDSSKIEKQLKQFVTKLEGGARLLVDQFKKVESTSSDTGYINEKNSNSVAQKLQEPSHNSKPNMNLSRGSPPKTELDDDEPPVQVMQQRPTTPAAPTAPKSRYTMGEDYDDDEPLTRNTPTNTPDTSISSSNSKHANRPAQFDKTNLPTFDELMQQEMQAKTADNWNDDD